MHLGQPSTCLRRSVSIVGLGIVLCEQIRGADLPRLRLPFFKALISCQPHRCRLSVPCLVLSRCGMDAATPRVSTSIEAS